MKLLYILYFLSTAAFGSDLINCEYAHGMKSFTTHNVTKLETIQKDFSMNNVTYKVHIENTAAYAEEDDYIVIKNDKGHTITYALECK